MKKIIYLLTVLLAFGACDIIDQDDRYEEKPDKGGSTGTFVKKVLLEDFTGQLCINCPMAAVEAERLQEEYDGRLIVVGVHAGSQSTPFFQTNAGDEYLKAFYPEGDGAQGGYPAGMFDRSIRNGSFVSKVVGNWGAIVGERMQLEAKLDLSLYSKYDEATNSIVVQSTIKALSQMKGLKLQLWVIENGIKANQIGQTNYIHNHVLRGAVNTAWGEDVETINGDKKYISKSFELKKSWKPDSMEVVGFVYDAQTKEVLQSTKVKLKGMDFTKKVLLEDFTGQFCINCPAAALEAERLQNEFDHRLILIGIHAGNQSTGFFQTDAGNEYLKTFYPEGDGAQGGYPAGMVDRASFGGNIISKKYQSWGSLVENRLKLASEIAIDLSCAYNEQESSIVVSSDVLSTTDMNAKLLLLVTESDIEASQAGQTNYAHNHVLRGAVNGIWGEEIKLTKGNKISNVTLPYNLKKNWKPENMKVIGLVYNLDNKEVLQCTEIDLIKK